MSVLLGVLFVVLFFAGSVFLFFDLADVSTSAQSQRERPPRIPMARAPAVGSPSGFAGVGEKTTRGQTPKNELCAFLSHFRHLEVAILRDIRSALGLPLTVNFACVF